MLCTPAVELDFQDQIAEGETYYVELQRKSQSYGECWKEAMSNLHTGCKQLTEDVQSRLALAFANCFLKHTGIGACLCNDDVSISDCLTNCSDRVYSTFTEFFTHTQSVCHYLQHKEWQVEMARTALLLTENSKKISKNLDESARSQFKILDLQQAALAEQKRSISNGKILTAELMRSRESARDLYNEFKTTTYEQKLLLFEIFDRMRNLQNFVLGEFTGVYTAAYYLVVATLVYILTSVPRTADARIWLILIISLNAVAEKFLTSYTLQRNSIEVNPIITSVWKYFACFNIFHIIKHFRNCWYFFVIRISATVVINKTEGICYKQR